MRILIVDDDQVNREYAKNILKNYGECEMATNGMEAVSLYEQSLSNEKPFDLMLLDIIMPKMDGFQVLRHIRRLEQQREIKQDDRVKIIVATSITFFKDFLDYLMLIGASSYVHKPVARQSLIEQLDNLELIPKDV